MNRFATCICVLSIIAAIATGCEKFGTNRQFKSILGDMEQVVSQLREVEKTSGDMLNRRESIEKDVCRKKLGLEELHSELKEIRQKLDDAKPEDMPMESNTIQTGVDPVTERPMLETSTTVDWGKVTGKSQKIWANLHTAYNSLATAVNTAKVACKCLESKDRKSLSCGVISFQLEPDRLNLELYSTEKAYINPARNIISGEGE